MFWIYYTTMLLNLHKSEDELWNQIWNLRTDIRKWIKNNIKIELNPSEKDIKEAYDLYLIMMKKKFLVVDKNYKLLNNDKHKIITAKKDWKVISYIAYQLFSNIDKLWKTKICALETIASDSSFIKYAPNTILYWEWIKFMKSLWFEYLNFNWVWYQYAEDEFNSLSRYKRKWKWIEIKLFSEKSIFWYIYWRYFRKYIFIKKIVYTLLVNLFKSKFLKY